MKQFFLSILLTIPLSIVWTQGQFNGVVVDEASGAGIPYVNIGVLNGTNGTVTDTQGAYQMYDIVDNEIIRFSCIGYHEKDLTKEALGAMDTIFLTPRSYKIPEAFIAANRLKRSTIIGKKIDNKDNVIAWGLSAQLGIEIGVIISIKKEVFIKSAHIGFSRASESDILLRINLYDFQNQILGANLLPQNIFIRSESISQDVFIDLSEYHITIDHDVLLTVEALERGANGKTGQLGFKAKSGFRSNIFFRDASQSDFYRSKERFGLGRANIGFYLTVH